jgi:23S rRNA-intervening sequence protein
LVHHIDELYKIIYGLAGKIPKRDRFGIHAKIENLCLGILELAIKAAFELKEHKILTLRSARTQIEILKRFIRIEHDLEIINEKMYIDLERRLQEISKMANGWIKYLN